jgi:hypothetical protein
MKTYQYKPKIVSFKIHPRFLAIDWETLKQGFNITVEHGDAVLHSFPSPTVQPRYAIGAGIGPEQMKRFFLRLDPETNLTEIVLEVNYKPFEKSLGVTDNRKAAEEWIQGANIIVQKHQQNK